MGDPNPTRDPQKLWTADQLAEHLGVTRQTVYNQMKVGLPSLKVGAARRFRLADVMAWLERDQ